MIVSEHDINVEENEKIKDDKTEGFVRFEYYVKYLKAAWGNRWSIFIILAVSLLF